ncbi:13968_t:CDS:2, partial [Cetraspora pellucida]
MFNDQEIINKSDLIFNNQKVISESNSMFNNQKAASESNSIFNDQKEFTNEPNSMFDDESVPNNQKIDDDCFGQIFERNQLRNYNESGDELWSDDSEHNNIDFSNDIYQNFVDIVIQHQLSYMASDAILKFIKKYGQIPKKALSRSIKKGLDFLDILKKNHIKFSSTLIVQVRDQIYSFKHQLIILAVKEILQNQEISMNCMFNYQKIFISKEHDKECTSEILEGLCQLVLAFNEYFGHISVYKGDIEKSE